jgi:hypothetical protein
LWLIHIYSDLLRMIKVPLKRTAGPFLDPQIAKTRPLVPCLDLLVLVEELAVPGLAAEVLLVPEDIKGMPSSRIFFTPSLITVVWLFIGGNRGVWGNNVRRDVYIHTVYKFNHETMLRHNGNTRPELIICNRPHT